MPELDAPTAFLSLVIFLLPGFMAIGFAERSFIRKQPRENALEHTLRVLSYSTAVYGAIAVALWLWPGTYEIADVAPIRDVTIDELAWKGLTVIAATILLLAILRVWNVGKYGTRIRGWLGMNPLADVPTAWDRALRVEQRCVVLATLVDGSRVAGLFASGSMATYSFDGGDLFLEQQLTFEDDGNICFPADPDSLGVWIRADQIATLEMRTSPE